MFYFKRRCGKKVGPFAVADDRLLARLQTVSPEDHPLKIVDPVSFLAIVKSNFP
jgi:hypothetical protein